MRAWLKGGLIGFFIGFGLMLIDFIRDVIFNIKMYDSPIILKIINPLSWFFYLIIHFKIIIFLIFFGVVIGWVISKIKQENYSILAIIGFILSFVPILLSIIYIWSRNPSSHLLNSSNLVLYYLVIYSYIPVILISLILNILSLKYFNEEKRGKWMSVVGLILTIFMLVVLLFFIVMMRFSGFN